MVEDGEIIYKSVNYEEPTQDDYEYVPFVREGVKWVCYYDNPVEGQDDVLPGGKHYFTLEIKGDTVINGKSYKPVHYYSGTGIDEENDTVPVFVREDQMVVYALIPDDRQYLECPVGIGSMVLLPDLYSSATVGQEFSLYRFRYPDYYTFIGAFGVNVSNLPIYKGASYEGRDMVQVGDRMNRRYHYRSQGVDQYVVEGIGYVGDSPGTPFNYFYAQTGMTQVQYYLSHVIKDGEIIFQTENYIYPDYPDYDINGDGIVDVLDVTCLIAMILQGDSQSSHPGYTPNVADVVWLIAYVLEH